MNCPSKRHGNACDEQHKRRERIGENEENAMGRNKCACVRVCDCVCSPAWEDGQCCRAYPPGRTATPLHNFFFEFCALPGLTGQTRSPTTLSFSVAFHFKYFALLCSLSLFLCLLILVKVARVGCSTLPAAPSSPCSLFGALGTLWFVHVHACMPVRACTCA